MTHLLHYPTATYFACGMNAAGRRNTRVQCDPANTTCRHCLAWIEMNPEWEPVTADLSYSAVACLPCRRGDSHHYLTCPNYESGVDRLMREVFE